LLQYYRIIQLKAKTSISRKRNPPNWMNKRIMALHDNIQGGANTLRSRTCLHLANGDRERLMPIVSWTTAHHGESWIRRPLGQ
jgi:hypothetical protein